MVCSSCVAIYRTYDEVLVKKLGSHASIYPFIIDDGCPENSDDWYPILSDSRYYLIPWLISVENDPLPMGIIYYYKINHVLFEERINGFLIIQLVKK